MTDTTQPIKSEDVVDDDPVAEVPPRKRPRRAGQACDRCRFRKIKVRPTPVDPRRSAAVVVVLLYAALLSFFVARFGAVACAVLCCVTDERRC